MNTAQRVLNLAESATLAVTAKAASMKAKGVDVIGFGAGEPDFDTPDHIKKAAIDAIRAGHTKYSKPASGIPAAKKAVCEKFARENRLHYTPDQVMISAGAKMAISLLIHAVIDPGDEVIIPVPYWVSYPEIVKLAGGVPKFITGPEEKDFRLTPKDLRSILTDRTRLFILNSPSNPSGVTYSPREIHGLAEVLGDRDLLVLSDEIYDRLVYDGQEMLSYAAVSDATYAQTITLNGASKTYAMTGWRLGYAAGPTDIIRAMSKLQSHSTSGAATFNQHALVEALTGNQSAVARMRAEFQRRARHMYERLIALPGVRCPKPTGAFYCFPNVSDRFEKLGVSGSTDFASRLLEEAKVAVVPGIAFGLDGHVRLSFAASMEQIDKGLDRIAAFLK